MGVPKIPELEVKNSSHEEKKPWSRRLSARSMSKKLRRSMDSLHEVMTPRNSYPDYSNGAETNFQYFKRRLSARFGHDVSERKSRSSKETRQAPSTDSGSETNIQYDGVSRPDPNTAKTSNVPPIFEVEYPEGQQPSPAKVALDQENSPEEKPEPEEAPKPDADLTAPEGEDVPCVAVNAEEEDPLLQEGGRQIGGDAAEPRDFLSNGTEGLQKEDAEDDGEVETGEGLARNEQLMKAVQGVSVAVAVALGVFLGLKGRPSPSPAPAAAPPAAPAPSRSRWMEKIGK